MIQSGKNVSPKSNEGRNLYVVEHITSGLLELMEQKPFGSISVSEICEKAGVGRASFYRNFESKEDIIRKHLHNLLEEWWAGYTGTTTPELVAAIFDYFYERKNLYIMLYKQGLAYISLQSVKDSCGPKPEHNNAAAYFAAFFSYGLYGWIEEWFKRGLQETPREMVELWKQAQSETARNK